MPVKFESEAMDIFEELKISEITFQRSTGEFNISSKNKIDQENETRVERMVKPLFLKYGVNRIEDLLKIDRALDDENEIYSITNIDGELESSIGHFFDNTRAIKIELKLKDLIGEKGADIFIKLPSFFRGPGDSIICRFKMTRNENGMDERIEIVRTYEIDGRESNVEFPESVRLYHQLIGGLLNTNEIAELDDFYEITGNVQVKFVNKEPVVAGELSVSLLDFITTNFTIPGLTKEVTNNDRL